MVNGEILTSLQNIVQTSESLMILFAPGASRDVQASTVAIYQLAQSVGKNPRLLTPQKSDSFIFTELEAAQTELGQENLVVSFPYSLEKVDKVSYHISEELQRFYLTIKPKSGVAPLDTADVQYTYTGASVDAVITLGITNQEELEQLYFGYEELFASIPIFVIAESGANFGTHLFETSGHSCMSEAVAQLITQAEYTLSPDAATALLSAIEQQTQLFSSLSCTAETFEAVALLLKSGARRSPRSTESKTVTHHEVVLSDGQKTPKKKDSKKKSI
ncbi:hypothetical protein KA078_03460 [Candidatus Woesebacteria bacterium]|nr:hypothetical protein [Candidatus Woesebacteria bacterium]